MSLSNTTFHPSRVEDRIYDLMMQEEYIANMEIQTESLFLAVYNMMTNEFPEVEEINFEENFVVIIANENIRQPHEKDLTIHNVYADDNTIIQGIIKSSPNIIDLIEVGDYVNGHLVFDIAYAPKKAVYIEDNTNKMAHIPYVNENIKSIVTKEQFSQMEYKVGE